MVIIGACTIRFAEYEDIPAIMKYIDEYWKKGHILATNRELFEWQYIYNEKVNFVLGLDEANHIQGILGFIPYSREDDKDIALALWKANRSESFLGIRLLLFLKKNGKYRNIVCPGINMRTTSKIYTQCGFQIGIMHQWYRLSNSRDYIIGKIVDHDIPTCCKSQYSLILLNNITELEKCTWIQLRKGLDCPYKSLDYLKKRYFNHPAYEYLVYEVRDENDESNAIVVLRIQECNNSKVFRFVDFIGDQAILGEITFELDRLMEQYEVEYIDMYEIGLADDGLINAGWKKVKDSKNIIPNYFAPYEQSNVDIFYCTSDENAVLFRGDGDQDRPN